MSRPPRQDHRPIIEVPGVSREREVAAALAGHLREGERLYLYQHTRNPTQFYFKVFEHRLKEVLHLAELSGDPIDAGLLLKMFMLVDTAKVQPTGEPPILRNEIPYDRVRLVSVGSRIRYSNMTELADRLGIRKSTLIKKLGPMRRSYLVVNQYEGRGPRESWLDLAADVVWRGEERIRKAYVAVQSVNDAFVLVGLDEGPQDLE